MRLSRGFSLIELMVSISIIAVLGALLIPGLSRTMEAARKTRCAVNLRSQHNLLLLYMDGAGGGWLPSATTYMDYGRSLVEPFNTIQVPKRLRVCPQDPLDLDYAAQYGTSYMYPAYAAFSMIPQAANPRGVVTRWYMDDPNSILFQDTAAFHAGKRQLVHPDGSVE